MQTRRCNAPFRMLRLVILAASALGTACSGPSAARTSRPVRPPLVERAPEVIDATEPYFSFWARHRDHTLEIQIDAFVTEVVPTHPDLYTADVIGLSEEQPYEEALRERLRLVLPMIRPRLEEVRATHRAWAEHLEEHQASFLRAFPDFAYEGQIVVMGAIGGFDGATRTIRDREALLFGVDDMVLFHPTGSDLAPFFHHELFHVYHRMAQRDAGVDSRSPRSLRDALWMEGLAVYVSERLNPGASLLDLSLAPALVRDVDARRDSLVRSLVGALSSTDPATYGTWFLGGQDGDVPERAGYYLGLLVVRQIAQGRPLRELSRWHGEPLHQAIDAALASLTELPEAGT